MADNGGLGKLVPGFDFLQGLVKNAGAALPSIGQWIAPTLNPEELEKRIEELRTVQFWLEQNARMLAATIQALEVQRMTLSTLKNMNVSVEALRDSMTLSPAAAPAAAPAASFGDRADQDDDDKAQAPAKAGRKPAAKRGAPAAGVVDPMNWWGALTNQFTQLATQAMKDMVKETATEGAKNLATELVKQSFSAAEQTLKAGIAPVKKVASMAGSAAGAATGAVAAATDAAKKSRSAARKQRTGAAKGAAKKPAR